MNFSRSISLVAILTILGGLFPLKADDAGTVFGKGTQSEAALMGVLYDIKQRPDRESSGGESERYFNIVDEFLAKHWDEAVLNRYYRVSKPIYTTQIFIPDMNADSAPKAFGAEKTVQPSYWIIHYKGQVSPPVDGTYRFVGCADDLIAVGVNEKTVLVAKMGGNAPNAVLTWNPSDPDGPAGADNQLRHGDWMTLKANEIIDLDVIIGERPGGSFNAFLLIEKQGETYPKDEKGNPILPIFQIAPYDTPAASFHDAPPFSKGFPAWKSYQ